MKLLFERAEIELDALIIDIYNQRQEQDIIANEATFEYNKLDRKYRILMRLKESIEDSKEYV